MFGLGSDANEMSEQESTCHTWREETETDVCDHWNVWDHWNVIFAVDGSLQHCALGSCIGSRSKSNHQGNQRGEKDRFCHAGNDENEDEETAGLVLIMDEKLDKCPTFFLS